MKEKVPCSRYWLFLFVLTVCLVLDLVSKSLVFRHFGMPGEQMEWWLIPGVLGIQTSLNEGALWGMGQGFSTLFAFMSVAAFLFIWGWLFWGKAALSRFWTVTLGMMAGGVLGNMFDRLALHGLQWKETFSPWMDGIPIHSNGETVHAVRDWILVMLGSYHWPNFNLADSFMVVGMILILVETLWEEIFKKEPQEPLAKKY